MGYVKDLRGAARGNHFLFQYKKAGDEMPTCNKRQSYQTGRFIAVDRTAGRKVIASGTSAQVTIRKAEQTGRNYTIAYVPPPGKKYIF